MDLYNPSNFLIPNVPFTFTVTHGLSSGTAVALGLTEVELPSVSEFSFLVDKVLSGSELRLTVQLYNQSIIYRIGFDYLVTASNLVGIISDSTQSDTKVSSAKCLTKVRVTGQRTSSSVPQEGSTSKQPALLAQRSSSPSGYLTTVVAFISCGESQRSTRAT